MLQDEASQSQEVPDLLTIPEKQKYEEKQLLKENFEVLVVAHCQLSDLGQRQYLGAEM